MPRSKIARAKITTVMFADLDFVAMSRVTDIIPSFLVL
jgi:hypothetical protein